MFPTTPWFRFASFPHGVCLLCAVLGVAGVAPTPARAATVTPTSVIAVTPLFADQDNANEGWGVRRLLGSLRSRERIIQIAVFCMCVGLFIMMRKFHV